MFRDELADALYYRLHVRVMECFDASEREAPTEIPEIFDRDDYRHQVEDRVLSACYEYAAEWETDHDQVEVYDLISFDLEEAVGGICSIAERTGLDFLRELAAQEEERQEKWRADFFEGWKDAGGYVGDLEAGSPRPWCMPWLGDHEMPYHADGYEEGRQAWADVKDEVLEELRREEEE